MARTGAAAPRHRIGSPLGGWRGLGSFWLLVAVLTAASGVTLEVLGPPRPPPAPSVAAVTAPPAPEPSAAGKPAVAAAQPRDAPIPPEQRPGRSTAGPVADPDPALVEPIQGSKANVLPRIADDGRMPMQVYAAGFDGTTQRPRVSILIAGIGLNQAESEAAIHSLPGPVTLAISPYARDPTRLLADARLAEHEYLLSIPMEPEGYPLNDPGPQALMTTLPLEQNRQRLDWALSRIAGYVGATGALGGMFGERFASIQDEMDPVLGELARRGLLYVDPRPGAAPLPLAWSATVDLIIDEPDTAADIDDKLAQLAKLAHDKRRALGLVTAPRPGTVRRIAAWTDGLLADGLALTPVSALVHPPAKASGE